MAAAIGDYYLAARNPDAAIKEYQRGLTYDPKNEELQLRLLETLLNTGKIDDATKMTDRMLKDNPGDVMARITHARLLAIKGNSAEAITTLARGHPRCARECSRRTIFWDRCCVRPAIWRGPRANCRKP